MKVFKRYKLPAIRQISPADVTIVNSTVLHLKIAKGVDLKRSLRAQEKIVTM